MLFLITKKCCFFADQIMRIFCLKNFICIRCHVFTVCFVFHRQHFCLQILRNDIVYYLVILQQSTQSFWSSRLYRPLSISMSKKSKNKKFSKHHIKILKLKKIAYAFFSAQNKNKVKTFFFF
jgi:hypothetical protein